MKIALTIFTVAALGVLAGCNGTVGEKKELLEAAGEKKFLTVDFQKNHPLRYHFVSSRDITVKSTSGRELISKNSESMEMVVAYTPVEIDLYGLTTIKATCESVKVKRSSSTGRQAARKDAVESFAGRTFEIKLGPAGKVEDYSQLDDLIREIGKKAFRPDKSRGRVKEPDMICDFIATQWFLWDSVSSIEKAAEGVAVDQSWKSRLSVPTPMVMRKARDVTYTLGEIRHSEEGQIAAIRSSYSLAESVPKSWPIPYTGAFWMSGPFGFYGNYKTLTLNGQGEELFNIDAGRIERYNQNYIMHLTASPPMNVGANLRIVIKQKLSMKFLAQKTETTKAPESKTNAWTSERR